MHGAWALGLLLLCGAAYAQQTTEIYRCLDADGRRHYTNSKRDTVGMKCELVTTQINVAPPQGRTPSNFPRESPRQSASARERQREILERELASEHRALEQARQ